MSNETKPLNGTINGSEEVPSAHVDVTDENDEGDEAEGALPDGHTGGQ